VGQQRYSAANDEHLQLAGRWLGRMHASAAREAGAGIRDSLPDRGPGGYLVHLRSGRRHIVANLGNPALAADEVALLRSIVSLYDRLEEQWPRLERSCEGMPATLVHGDFRPKNAYVRAHATGLQLLPIDWEMAGWGVAAADLARVDVDAYYNAVRDDWPSLDRDALGRLAAVGQVFRFLAAIDWDSQCLAYESADFLSRPMACMVVLHQKLADAMREAGLPE
jgi:Ser/Thr protein kinase RdoA (MazF antagonist)